MGPQSESSGTLYWDGMPIMQGELQEITVPADAQEQDFPRRFDTGMVLTFTMRAPKCWRCQSRKRFIKLLMSKGIGRNQAGSVARVARIAGVPYGELWRSYFFWG